MKLIYRNISRVITIIGLILLVFLFHVKTENITPLLMQIDVADIVYSSNVSSSALPSIIENKMSDAPDTLDDNNLLNIEQSVESITQDGLTHDVLTGYIILLMKFIMSVIFICMANHKIRHSSNAADKNWAFGLIGTIVGFWFGGGI